MDTEISREIWFDKIDDQLYTLSLIPKAMPKLSAPGKFPIKFIIVFKGIFNANNQSKETPFHLSRAYCILKKKVHICTVCLSKLDKSASVEHIGANCMLPVSYRSIDAD